MDLQSLLGYSKGSPYANNPYLDIHTPEGLIDMSNTPFDLFGIDNKGNKKKMKAGRKNPYKFEGDVVREIPMQVGGRIISRDSVGWLDKYDDGGTRMGAMDISIPNLSPDHSMYQKGGQAPINLYLPKQKINSGPVFNPYFQRNQEGTEFGASAEFPITKRFNLTAKFNRMNPLEEKSSTGINIGAKINFQKGGLNYNMLTNSVKKGGVLPKAQIGWNSELSNLQAKEQPQLKASNIPISRDSNYGQKVDPYLRITSQDPQSQVNITSRKRKEFARNLAVGTLVPYVAAELAPLGLSALDAIGSTVAESSIVNTIGQGLTTNIGGIAGANLMNAGSAYIGSRALMNTPNLYNQWSNVKNLRDVGNASTNTLFTALDVLPIAGSMYRGAKNLMPTRLSNVGVDELGIFTQQGDKKLYELGNGFGDLSPVKNTAEYSKIDNLKEYGLWDGNQHTSGYSSPIENSFVGKSMSSYENGTPWYGNLKYKNRGLLNIMRQNADEGWTASLKLQEDANRFVDNGILPNNLSQSNDLLYKNWEDIDKEINVREAFNIGIPKKPQSNNPLVNKVISYIPQTSLTDKEVYNLLDNYNPTKFNTHDYAGLKELQNMMHEDRMAATYMYPKAMQERSLIGPVKFDERMNQKRLANNAIYHPKEQIINNNDFLNKASWQDLGNEYRGVMEQLGLDPIIESDVNKFRNIKLSEKNKEAFTVHPYSMDLFKGMSSQKMGGNIYQNGGMSQQDMFNFLFDDSNTEDEVTSKAKDDNTAPTTEDVRPDNSEQNNLAMEQANNQENYYSGNPYAQDNSSDAGFGNPYTGTSTNKVFEVFYNNPETGGFTSRKYGKDLGHPISGHRDHLHFAATPNILEQVAQALPQYGLTYGEGLDKKVNPVHTKTSFHYKGEALDINSPGNVDEPKRINRFINEYLKPKGLYKKGGHKILQSWE